MRYIVDPTTHERVCLHTEHGSYLLKQYVLRYLQRHTGGRARPAAAAAATEKRCLYAQ